MEIEELEYRMYGLVPYNISPIQQAIQYGHALQEYNNEMIKFLNSGEDYSSKARETYLAFEKWALDDKTFIILNGGTTNRGQFPGAMGAGTLNKHWETLIGNGVKVSIFHEPDLGYQLTAVVFLVDERVWDKKKYPDYNEFIDNLTLEQRTEHIDKHFDNYWVAKWEESLGGEQNVFLREFLSQFRLA